MFVFMMFRGVVDVRIQEHTKGSFFLGVGLYTLVPLCGARVPTAPTISWAPGNKTPFVLSVLSCCQGRGGPTKEMIIVFWCTDLR